MRNVLRNARVPRRYHCLSSSAHKAARPAGGATSEGGHMEKTRPDRFDDPDESNLLANDPLAGDPLAGGSLASGIPSSWREDRESYLPDDDPFAEEGLVGDPLGGSDYELVYRIGGTSTGRPYLCVAGYRGAPVTLEVPESWDGMPVTDIEPGAFEGCETLVSLTVAGSVTCIGEAAFAECKALREAELPWDLCEVADDLFLNCVSLERVDLSGNVTQIGDGSFYGCTSLWRFDVTQAIESVGDHAFGKCERLRSFDFSLVDTIGMRAFEGCTSLEEVWIGHDYRLTGDLVIGVDAFMGCTSLKSVTIERPKVIELSHGSLAGCTALERASIIGGIYEVPGSAFAGCSSLLSVKVSHCLQSIGEKAFFGCTSLATFDVVFDPAFEDEPCPMWPIDISDIEAGDDAFGGCPLAF